MRLPRNASCWSVCLFLITGGAAWADALRPTGEAAAAFITSCIDIRELAREDAAKGKPVKVRGVVTLKPLNTAGPYNFTLDDGAGIWISPPARLEGFEFPEQLQTGDLVEVEGITNEGRFSPMIVARRVRLVGKGEQPVARLATPRELATGALDSQRVQLEGVVQAAELIEGSAVPELRLRVRNQIGLFTYTLLNERAAQFANLVDARVRLTGVCLSFFNSRRQFLGARLYSNVADDIVVLRSGMPDPFAAPLESLAEVLTFSPRGADLHRRQVRGTVTLASPGKFFYLQDGAAALRVNTRQVAPLEPGDVVEAAGFLNLEHHRGEMSEAVFRRAGRVTPPAPVPITREQAYVREPQTVFAVPQDFDDRLVSIEGVFVNMDERPGELPRLNLMSEGALVPVDLVAVRDVEALARFQPGSVLRISGVCQMTYSANQPVVDWPQPIAMHLLVRDAQDITVVEAASWWTPARLLVASGGLALVLFAALAWVALLRRQVAQRGTQLAEEMRARRDAAVEFATVLRERNRLAADLHDTMEQSLTGTAMQLEASQALRGSVPERANKHLELARQLLASSREDLRRSIWNLKADPLERLTFPEALREVAAGRIEGLGIGLSIKSQGVERALPDSVSGNLLLLLQEAITNALKHADPKNIEITMEFEPRAFTLIIRDDGRGFDPDAVAGPATGHFGLQGMRERAKRFGGEISIRSAPGQGTVVTACVSDLD